MRKLSLAKSGFNKIKSHQLELKASDLEDSVKSLPPGEWCLLTFQAEAWVGFVNSQIEDRYPCCKVLEKLDLARAEAFRPEGLIEEKIRRAREHRLLWTDYEAGSRLFYGTRDGLPGLLADEFENAVIVQINTAGLDRFRDHITATFANLTKKQVHLLDNQKYREKEFLPTFDTGPLPELSVKENGLRYTIRSEVLQKVGFYYDHRENRRQLMALVGRLRRKPELGVDLFCYAGAWGMSALKSGAARVEFVDQGDFEVEVRAALEANGFAGRGAFRRMDVFKFLDEAVASKKSFDLVLCDPPAFAKSLLQKTQALEGYSKLHRRVAKVAAPGALCAFSSCTHYVTEQEFQKNILDAASKEGRRLQLIHSGLQGFDHPVDSLSDKSNYIKSFFYILE